MIQENTIKCGIENLLNKSILDRTKEFKPAFIDIIPTHDKSKRRIKITIPEKWEINEDEKGNLCDWIIENGT
jgi:hypothetical protein